MKKRKTLVAAALATAGIGSPTAVMAKTGNFIQDNAYVVARSVCADRRPGVHFSASDAARYMIARHGYRRQTTTESRQVVALAAKIEPAMDRYCEITASEIRSVARGYSSRTIPTRYTHGSLSDTPFEF